MLPHDKPQCSHCGATSHLARRESYIGGKGYVEHFTCVDRPACWLRWEIKHVRASRSLQAVA